MLAGDEQAWKEAKEVINTVGAPKSHEGILDPYVVQTFPFRSGHYNDQLGFLSLLNSYASCL